MFPTLFPFKILPVLIEVIPFGGSIDNKGLTYFVRDELAEGIKIGCLVEVPFRNSIDYAVVTNMDTSLEISENIRSIVRIVTRTPLLSRYQIQSIFDSSSYYFVHAHHILSLFLSKTLVRYLEKKDFVGLLPKIDDEEKGTPGAIRFYHHATGISFFSAVQEHVMENTILIFPDDFSIEAYLRFHPLDPDTTLVIPDKLTETKKYKAFCSVYNGEKKLIIGTRRILYYNLSKYKNILYIEDSLHGRAMRFGHTYRHLEILRIMAPYSHFHITILSSLPSIESMYLLHMGTYKR